MSEPHFPSDPPRLAGDAGDAARLMAQAEREFRGGLDESAAFRRLERTRRRRKGVVWIGTAAAVAAGLAVVGGHGLGSRGGDRVEVTAEVRTAGPFRARPGAQGLTKAAPTADSEQAPRALPSPSNLPNSAPHSAAGAAPPSESKCREWSAAGRTERAIECFRSVARGTGLEGEVALYEAARLTADGLHDPGRALGLLAEYDQRFTGGAMRGEAAWLRVRALRGAGRLDEALRTSEALLARAEGRALASELHWLRGQIYQENQHDCARAVSEFVALVGEPGERGDEAELRRGRCLEQLGRVDDAVLAYERYLGRSEPRHAAEARERIAALRP